MASTSSMRGAYSLRRRITAYRRPANTGWVARPVVVKAIIRRRTSRTILTESSPGRRRSTGIDWHTVTESSFFTDLATSINKFEEVIGSDEPLKDFRKAGGKMITYHGLADPLIFPRGTYHYYNQVLQGNYKETQKFYRFFPYPGGSHCTGGVGPQIDAEALFSDLVQWVENAVAPSCSVTAGPMASPFPKDAA